MIKKILLVAAVFIVAILVYAGVKSPDMQIEREIVIKATPEKLFPFINSSQKSNEWMPWIESDPSIKMIYSGPADGIGSKASWDSTGKMGTGTSEIVESSTNQFVKFRLDYEKPMQMSQKVVLSLLPNSSDETTVKWSASFHNSYSFRLFGVFINVDKMVGNEFEKGLKKLKRMTEG